MNEKANDPKPGEEEGRGWGATIAGAVVLAVVVALGIWLADEMADNARYAKCIAARHRNCDNIDYRAAPPPQQ